MLKFAIWGIPLTTTFTQGIWYSPMKVDLIALVDPFLIAALLFTPRAKSTCAWHRLVTFAAVAWVSWEALGITQAVNKGWALGDVGNSLRALGLFFVFRSLQTWNHASAAVKAIVLAVMLQALVAAMQWRLGIQGVPFFQRGIETWRSSGTFPFSSNLGLYLAMTTHIVLGWALTHPKRAFIGSMACGFAVLALFTTYNRASWLAITATLPLPVLWALRSRISLISRRVYVVATLGVIGAPIFIAKYGGKVMDRLFFMLEETLVGDEPQSRQNLLKDGLRIATENPVFGASKSNYIFYADPNIPGLPYVHNNYIFIAAETGFFCLAMFLLVLVGSLMMGITTLRKKGGDPRARALLVTTTTGIVAFATSSMTTPDYHIHQIRFAFWMVVGLHFASAEFLRRSVQVEKYKRYLRYVEATEASQTPPVATPQTALT